MNQNKTRIMMKIVLNQKAKISFFLFSIKLEQKKNCVNTLIKMRSLVIYTISIFLGLSLCFSSKISNCNRFSLHFDQYYNNGNLIISLDLSNEKKTIYLALCQTTDSCLSGLDRMNKQIYSLSNKHANVQSIYNKRLRQNFYQPQNITDISELINDGTKATLLSLHYNKFATLNSRVINLFRFDKTGTKTSIIPLNINNVSFPLYYKSDYINHKGCKDKIDLFVIPELSSKPIIDDNKVNSDLHYPSLHGMVVDVNNQFSKGITFTSTEDLGELGVAHPLLSYESDAQYINPKKKDNYVTDLNDYPTDGILDLSALSPIWYKYVGYIITENELVMIDRDIKEFEIKHDKNRNTQNKDPLPRLTTHAHKNYQTLDENKLIEYFQNYKEWMENEYSVGVTNWFKKKFISRLFFRIDPIFDPNNRFDSPVTSQLSRECEMINHYNRELPFIDNNLFKNIKGLFCTFNVRVQGENGWTLCIDYKRLKSFVPNFLTTENNKYNNTWLGDILIDFEPMSCIPTSSSSNEHSKHNILKDNRSYDYKKEFPANSTSIKMYKYTTFNHYHTKLPSDLKLIIWGREEAKSRTKIIVHDHDLFLKTGVGFAVGLTSETLYNQTSVNMHIIEVIVVLICFIILMRNVTSNKTFFEICLFYTNTLSRVLQDNAINIKARLGIQLQDNLIDNRTLIDYNVCKNLPMFKRIYRIHHSVVGWNVINCILSLIMFIVYIIEENSNPEVPLFWIWMSLYCISLQYLLYDSFISLYEIVNFNIEKWNRRRKSKYKTKSIYYKIFCDVFIDVDNLFNRRDPDQEHLVNTYKMAFRPNSSDIDLYDDDINEKPSKEKIKTKGRNKDVSHMPIKSLLGDFSSIFVCITTIIMALWWNTTDMWNWFIIVILILVGCHKLYEASMVLIFIGIDSLIFSKHIKRAFQLEFNNLKRYNVGKVDKESLLTIIPRYFLDIQFLTYLSILSTVLIYSVIISYYGIIDIILPLMLAINDKYSETVVMYLVIVIMIMLVFMVINNLKDKLDNVVDLNSIFHPKNSDTKMKLY
jgi:hypothetical protein